MRTVNGKGDTKHTSNNVRVIGIHFSSPDGPCPDPQITRKEKMFGWNADLEGRKVVRGGQGREEKEFERLWI